MIEPTKKDKAIQDRLKESGEIPKHIAIIMDGNGRWAKARNKSRIFGHRQGVTSVRDIVECCGQIGVKYLTLYTFSTENWKRPKTEVSILMKLLIKSLRDETDRLNENNVRLFAIGDLKSLPENVYYEMLDAIEKTKNNKLMTLTLAISYSGRWDILNAIKNISEDIKRSKINSEQINEKLFSQYLTTSSLPDPDLLIRTGSEFRISNFLLWELAYTEIYIDKIFWPEFRRVHLYEAIKEYQKRERRFGMVSEQLKTKK